MRLFSAIALSCSLFSLVTAGQDAPAVKITDVNNKNQGEWFQQSDRFFAVLYYTKSTKSASKLVFLWIDA
jgi:predicted AAA+ superfamily ATPase